MGCRKFEQHALTPRLKIAARLYASGAVRTQAEASRAVGLNPNHLSFAKCRDPRVNALIQKIDKQLEEGTINMSQLMVTLGRRAVRNIAYMAENAEKEEIRLRANVDLADRSMETSKTTKLSLDSDVKLLPEDIAALRATMLEAARTKELFLQAATGDFVTVDDEKIAQRLALVKGEEEETR